MVQIWLVSDLTNVLIDMTNGCFTDAYSMMV